MKNEAMDEENLLSAEVTKNAHHASNGELAWKKEDIPAALDELSKLHLAVLGGEIWGVHDGKIWGMLPMKKGVPAVYSWNTTDKNTDGSWDDYVKRSIEECRDAVRNGISMEDEVQDFLRGKLHFNLSICDEKRYKELFV